MSRATEPDRDVRVWAGTTRGSPVSRAERGAFQPPTAEPDPGNAGAGRESPHGVSFTQPVPVEGVGGMKRKVYVEGSRPDLQVPFSEIELSGGEPPLRLYDSSGPGGDP